MLTIALHEGNSAALRLTVALSIVAETLSILYCFRNPLNSSPLLQKRKEELNKHDNEAETSQSVQEMQSHMPWNDDIYSKVQGPEKRGQVRCMGKIPKPKKLKASLSENQELRDKVKQMQEQQNNTNAVLVNVLSLIQNRFSGEDVNDILRAARQVTDASSSPNQTDSPSPYTNED